MQEVKNCKVFVAPYDVYLDEHSNAVEPDIIVVLKENESIIKKHIHGVPDILIEILSEGNKNHDLIRKKELYEKFGVKEYYVIEPETCLVFHFQLQNGSYTLTSEQIGKLISPLLNKAFEFNN